MRYHDTEDDNRQGRYYGWAIVDGNGRWIKDLYGEGGNKWSDAINLKVLHTGTNSHVVVQELVCVQTIKSCANGRGTCRVREGTVTWSSTSVSRPTPLPGLVTGHRATTVSTPKVRRFFVNRKLCNDDMNVYIAVDRCKIYECNRQVALVRLDSLAAEFSGMMKTATTGTVRLEVSRMVTMATTRPYTFVAVTTAT